MLADIRKYANSFVVKILFALLMLSFVIWGVADVFRPHSSTGWVAKVGDREIGRAEFDNELHATVRQLQQSFGESLDAAAIRSLGIARSVLNQLISRTLVRAEAAALNIRAGDELLRRTLLEDGRFRTSDGQFDNAAFQAFAQRLGRTQEGFFNDMRNELSVRALIESVETGVVLPKSFEQTIERYFAEQRKIDYVAVRFDAMQIDKAADADALKAFYDAHGEAYRRPEYRKVSAVIITASDLASQITIDEAELKAAYEERIDAFTRGERRTFRQMLFADEVKARWAAEQLKAAHKWEEVARASEAGGPAVATLGPIARNGLPEELRAAVFDRAADVVGDPVKSSLGWHLIDVVKVEPAATAPLSEVSQQLSQQLAAEKANDRMIDLGNKLEEAVGRGKSLEAAAEELGLKVRTIDAIDARGSDAAGKMLDGMPPKFVQTVFASPKGIPSSLIEADRDTLFLLRVDEVQPSVLRPFDEVRDAVQTAWLQEQRTQKARDTAQQIVDRAGTSSLADAATGFGLKLNTAGPFSRLGTPADNSLPLPVIRQAMEGPAGRVASIPTDQANFVVVSRPDVAASGAASDAVLDEERGKALDQLRDDLVAQYLEALRVRHPVRINQAALDDANKQAP